MNANQRAGLLVCGVVAVLTAAAGGVALVVSARVRTSGHDAGGPAAVTGVPQAHGPQPTGRATPPEKPARAGVPFSREEFKRRFFGATYAEVRAQLGPPEVIGAPSSQADFTGWFYSRVTIDPKTGRPDARVCLNFSGERVAFINY